MAAQNRLLLLPMTGQERRPNVLVIDADHGVRALLRHVLESAHYWVTQATQVEEAHRIVLDHSADVVLLDAAVSRFRLGLLLQQWRAIRPALGVIMMSRSPSAEQEIACLEAGADDYLHKPLHVRALVARIRTLMRRIRRGESLERAGIVRNGVCLLAEERELEFYGRRIALTRTETALLGVLLRASGRFVSVEQLMTDVWGKCGSAGETRIVHTNMYRLRRKVESDPSRPRWLVARHGVGYRFDAV